MTHPFITWFDAKYLLKDSENTKWGHDSWFITNPYREVGSCVISMARQPRAQETQLLKVVFMIYHLDQIAGKVYGSVLCSWSPTPEAQSIMSSIKAISERGDRRIASFKERLNKKG